MVRGREGTSVPEPFLAWPELVRCRLASSEVLFYHGLWFPHGEVRHSAAGGKWRPGNRAHPTRGGVDAKGLDPAVRGLSHKKELSGGVNRNRGGGSLCCEGRTRYRRQCPRGAVDSKGRDRFVLDVRRVQEL